MENVEEDCVVSFENKDSNALITELHCHPPQTMIFKIIKITMHL